MTIIAKQEQGYRNEYDLLDTDTDTYVGMIKGHWTNEPGGIEHLVWEIQRWRNGNPDGSILRPQAGIGTAEMIEMAKDFVK